MKVLISAFVCAPDMGSEAGRSWNLVSRLADHHEIWAITQSTYRAELESNLSAHPGAHLHFIFYDIPVIGLLVKWLSKLFFLRPYVSNVYYYLWQIAIYPVVVRLHTREQFDLTHHISYVRYWMPSLLALLPAPFIWGTVGGADVTPGKLRKTFPWRGRFFESVREFMLRLAEFDPLVRLTARRSAAVLAMTPATIFRLQTLGASNIIQTIDSGLGVEDELSELGILPNPPVPPLRFLSVGRLIHWKGYHLGLQAFAQLSDLEAEYWFFGDGPERARLEALCRRLGIQERVHFSGFVPREQVLRAYTQSHMFVHPSLHESGGWVILEAMAARRPVICLDLGGPSVTVTEQTGIKVKADHPQQVVDDLAGAMRRLALTPDLRRQMGIAGRQRVEEHFTWHSHIEQVLSIYSSFT